MLGDMVSSNMKILEAFGASISDPDHQFAVCGIPRRPMVGMNIPSVTVAKLA